MDNTETIHKKKKTVKEENLTEVKKKDGEEGKKKEDKKKEEKKKTKSAFSQVWKWPLLVLVMALSLSFTFGVASEYALSGAGIAVSIVVILVFVSIAIITDMIGVAVTVAQLGPFRAMASKKVRGAKESIKMIKNAEKVASVSADILGDICSILSGSAGATVTAVFIMNAQNQLVAVLIASAVSAVIAGLTIFGKALGKNYAMNNAEKIVLILGKVASIFHSQKENKKAHEEKKSHKKKSDKEETIKIEENEQKSSD